MVYMDENADAMGNYTILGFKHNYSKSGLYPIGDFTLNEQTNGPVSKHQYYNNT